MDYDQVSLDWYHEGVLEHVHLLVKALYALEEGSRIPLWAGAKTRKVLAAEVGHCASQIAGYLKSNRCSHLHAEDLQLLNAAIDSCSLENVPEDGTSYHELALRLCSSFTYRIWLAAKFDGPRDWEYCYFGNDECTKALETDDEIWQLGSSAWAKSIMYSLVARVEKEYARAIQIRKSQLVQISVYPLTGR